MLFIGGLVYFRRIVIFLENNFEINNSSSYRTWGVHIHMTNKQSTFQSKRVCAYLAPLRPVFGLTILVGMNSSAFGVRNHEQ